MLRIAMAEDNPADARMMRMALEQAGMPLEVTVLTDGLKAMEYLRARGKDAPCCDLLLLDLNLPRLSGYEVLEQIKSNEELKSLPVVVMSGSSDPTDVNRCYLAGANSYIVKPTHLAQILSAAAEIVRYWSNCVELPVRRPNAVAGVRGI